MKNQKLRSNYEITDNAGMVFEVGPEADFTGADLRGLDLSCSDFAGATLCGANLTFANVSYCDFTSAKLSPSEYAPVSLDWAVMIGSNFEFADLTRVSMVEAEASDANFFYACFEGANLTGADLSNANLSYAQMERADLRGVVMTNAELDNVTNFIVTNTGKNPLIIEKVEASCGCTTPEKPEKPILPGKSDKINVVFHPKPGQTGEQNKTVTVTSNTSPRSTLLKIKAFVK